MISDADIFRALSAFLEQHQPFSPALRIAYPKMNFKPSNKEKYLRVSFLPTPTQTMFLAGGDDSHSGTFQVDVCVPAEDTGLPEVLDMAAAIVGTFMSERVPMSNGRKIKIGTAPRVAAMVTDSVRPFVPVSIPYQISTS